jgi:tRNA (Thr-GGU) A37 N-methylase
MWVGQADRDRERRGRQRHRTSSVIQTPEEYTLRPIGRIRLTLRALKQAPRQGSEGARDAWLEVTPAFARGLSGIAAADEVFVITWLHRADREVLEVARAGGPSQLSH